MQGIGWGLHIRCPRCGAYVLDNENIFFRPPAGTAPFFACMIRQNWEETAKPMVIKDDAATFSLAVRHRETGVPENFERLLRYIGSKIRRPSETIIVDKSLDFPVIDVETPGDLAVYFKWLAQEGLIEDSSQDEVYSVALTKKGWERLAPSRRVAGDPGTCFVAMWFDASMNEAYELGILGAIEQDCNFRALRIDRKQHNNQITDEIMASIRSAEFMVADFTGHRAGVYYEAGFARGLGREVIYCCRTDSFEARHFDTSVINHVVWTGPADLRKKLSDRIRATILTKA